MNTDEDNLPYLMPTHKCFEENYHQIKSPIKALAAALINNSDLDAQEIGNTLFAHIEQLDFLIKHSYLNGDNILFAKVRHPFNLKPIAKKNEVEND